MGGPWGCTQGLDHKRRPLVHHLQRMGTDLVPPPAQGQSRSSTRAWCLSSRCLEHFYQGKTSTCEKVQCKQIKREQKPTPSSGRGLSSACGLRMKAVLWEAVALWAGPRLLSRGRRRGGRKGGWHTETGFRCARVRKQSLKLKLQPQAP